MSELNAAKLVKFYAGTATLRGPEGEYVDTFENYQLDAGKPPPPLPGGRGFIGRTYVPDEFHRLSDGTSDTSQAIPYQVGDQILAGLQQLLDNQAARRALPEDPEVPLAALRIEAIDALMDRHLTEEFPDQRVLDYIEARDG